MNNIVSCEHCHGTGIVQCNSCKGTGKVTCPDCDGSGRAYDICPDCQEGRVTDSRAIEDDATMPCPTCHGDYKHETGVCKACGGIGKVECEPCKGSGRVSCQSCNGTGKFDIDKFIKAAIVTDWYDVTSDKKINKKLLSKEDVTMLKTAADQGNGAACYVLGSLECGGVAYAEEGDMYFEKGAKAEDAACLYAHSIVLAHREQVDQKDVVDCLERSATNGNVHALVDIAVRLFDGSAADKEKALQYCKQLANIKESESLSPYLVKKANALGKCLPQIVKNDAKTMFELGAACADLFKMTGCAQDKMLAEVYLERAATNGNSEAVNRLAEDESKDNLSGAIEILDKAAKGGEKKAAERLQCVMQECLTGIRGNGIRGKETSERFEELKDCAKAGNIAAMKFLISAYKSKRLYEGPELCEIPTFGLADPTTMRTYDWESVAYWTEMAAKAGDGNSMLDYSLICRDGKGCDRDINKAFVWACDGFLKGGSRRRALRLLAEFYRCAYFSIPDSQKVTELLTRSAKAGYLPAIVAMGERYYAGKGVKKNRGEAKRLFEIAATAGSKDAKEKLKNILKNTSTGEGSISGITDKFLKDKDPLPDYVLSDYEKAKSRKLWSEEIEKEIKAKNKEVKEEVAKKKEKQKAPPRRWLFVTLGIFGGIFGLHFLYAKRALWFWTYWIMAAVGALQIEVDAFRDLLARVSPMFAKIPVFAAIAVLILVGSIFFMKKDGKGRMMK